MDYTLIYNIIVLSSSWNILGFVSSKSLSFCFSKLKIENKRSCMIISNLLRGCGYVFCSVALALNLDSVSRIEFWKIICNPKFYSTNILTEYSGDSSLVDDIFTFVCSFFATHLHDVISLNEFKLTEVRRSIFLMMFFFSGYCSKFLGIIFVIGAISSVSLASQSTTYLFLTTKGARSVIYFARQLIWLIFFLIWVYLYGYFVPVYCLCPIMLKNTTNVENRIWFDFFKVSFGCYYFAEIFNSVFVRQIQKFMHKFAKSYVKFFKAIYCHYSHSEHDLKLHSDEKEETLKMYTAQGKSPQEIKRQIELMQMVKCVVAIRKKMKRAKQNKEKLQSEYMSQGTH